MRNVTKINSAMDEELEGEPEEEQELVETRPEKVEFVQGDAGSDSEEGMKGSDQSQPNSPWNVQQYKEPERWQHEPIVVQDVCLYE